MGATIALMFAGQGSQYPRMGAGLYEVNPIFTDWMDRAFDAYGSGGAALRDAWLGTGREVDFDDARVSQPLLYAVGHALGRAVMSWGVQPIVFGHSAGEVVAATIAGVIDVDECMSTMSDRIGALSSADDGGMLAVAGSTEDVAAVLSDRVHLAAVNGPRQLLLAGRTADLEEATRALEAGDVTSFPVRARQAFHSPCLHDAATTTLPLWERMTLRAPRLPFYSAYLDGRQVDATVATDPAFWAYQAARTLRFDRCLTAVARRAPDLIIEAGAGTSLTSLARRHPDVRRHGTRLAGVLPDRAGDGSVDRDGLARARSLVAAALEDAAA